MRLKNIPFEGETKKQGWRYYTHEHPNRKAIRKLQAKRSENHWVFIKFDLLGRFLRVDDEDKADARYHFTKGLKAL